MGFDLFNYLNCTLECVSMLFIWRILDNRGFNKWNYLLSYACLCTFCIFITFIDSIGFAILPLNFLMVFAGFWIGFRERFKRTLTSALFVYLLLLYLQSILVCFLPQTLMGTNTGNLIVNGFVLTISLVLMLFGQKFRFAEIYQSNLRAVWIFLLALCFPEIVLAQAFVALLGSASSLVMVILLLLQILYMTLVVLLFFLLKRKSETRQLADTQKYIREMNEHLEESRRSMHDFNKHIRYLRNEVAVGSDNPELVRRVDAYCAGLIDIYGKEEILLQLDNPVLRAILYGRRTQATTNHIDFILNATPVLPDFPLKNYQIVEIFDNLLDNAFECVVELPETERWIRVTLSATPHENGETHHMLCIENPCRTLNFSAIASDEKYTSKGGRHQGIGLKHVAHMVADTGGKLILNNQNGLFTVRVLYVR